MLPKVTLSAFAFILSLSGALAKVSTSGRCGAGFGGVTCAGSNFGNCCSSKSWCGSSSDHCGSGCQSGFGNCASAGKPSTPGNPGTKPISRNARCGAENGGQTCQDSAFGNCCSKYGYCGSSDSYCGVSTCQKGYGTCNGAPAPAPSSVRTTLTSIVVPSQPSQPSQTAGTCSATTVTLAAETKTITISEQKTITQTSCGAGETKTITEESTVIQTISLPGEQTTITIPGQGEIITVTEPTTLPASTITLIGEGEIITVTEPTTLPPTTQTISEQITYTESLTTTIPAETVTSTATVAPLAPSQAIVGGDFTSLGNYWTVHAGPGIGYSFDQIASSNYALMLQAFADAPPNTIAFVTQSVALSPGTYKFSTSARYRSGGGTVELGVELIAGGRTSFRLLTETLGSSFETFSTDITIPDGTTHGLVSVVVTWIGGAGARTINIDYASMVRQ